ncbi:MAG: InlB B-repeat-containing protein [Faecalibacterium sp.]
MRKKSTRLLSAALAVCMMLSVLPVGAFAAEPGAEEQENGASAQADPVDSEFVEINDTNFPDPVFQQYVKDNIDTADTTSGQKDGRLSKAERDAVTEISIDNQNCTDLTGIAYFANLTTLRCQQNGLKELNLEYNKNLTDLNCSYNKLTTLDVSKNAKLRTLECSNNGMEELNLGDITSLKHLFCPENNLTELDVSKNRYLEQLHCRYNNLRRLVIGNNYSLTMLYLLGNHLTSLDLYHKSEIWNYDYATQSYTIDVNDDGTFDLDSLPEGFDASKTTDWEGGTRVGNTLNVNSHEVQYTYNTGSWHYRQKWMYVKLKVNGHKYQWKYDNAKHWRTCELSWCPGLTSAQRAEAPHDYTDAKDKDCNTCGYVRPLYTVTTVNATAKLESEAEELKAPVAAGTEVILTAGDAPEGKTFAGWKLYKVVNDTESEITDKTELAKLLKNGTDTTATLTMPAYNVKAEPYYSNIPYNITAVNCTVDKTEAAKGDTVTATRREPEANERFIGWTVKVNGVEQDADNFLTPDANDPAKVRFTMPAENVEIKANFEGNPTLNPTLRVGDHVTANIDGSDASVPSGSTVPVDATVHLTATVPDGQHFTGWTVKVGGEEQKADTFLTTPDENDPTKVTFIMPDANVEVTATFADDPIPEPDPVGPSDTGNIQGAISAVVIGAAAGAIIYEAGTGIYRVINMPGIPMPSNRIELAELLWEHAGKPEPVSTALYSDIDEGDTDAQKAARWAVEQDLMKDDADNNKFHPAFPVSKLRTCLTWNAAKEKGLFDKTEE